MSVGEERMEIFPQILISGADGFVGSALQRHLRKQGIPHAKLVRQTPSPGTSAFLWDPYHFQFREEMRRLNGIRAAIHLSGENISSGRWTVEKKRRIHRSRIDSTRSLVALLTQLEPRPEVLICASGMGYYGDRGDEVLTESSSSGAGFLPEVCREWEQAADTGTAVGIRVVNLRFGVILAAQGGALKQMLPLFKLGLGGTLGNGFQWMSWISLAEVLRVVDFCLAEPQISGPVNAVCPTPVTNREFTRSLAHYLHRPGLLRVPSSALTLVFGEMANAAILASTRALPAKLQGMGFTFQHSMLAAAWLSILGQA